MQVSIPDAPEPDEGKGSKLKRQGDEAFVKGDFGGAAQAYTQALRHVTSDHTIWANRSAAFLRTGAAEDALQDARRARTLKPEYAKVCLWHLCSRQHFACRKKYLGNLDISGPPHSRISYSRRFWKMLVAHAVQAYYREGSALQAMKDWEGAAQAFFEGFRMDPQNAAMAQAFQAAIVKAREAHAAAHQHK